MMTVSEIQHATFLEAKLFEVLNKLLLIVTERMT